MQFFNSPLDDYKIGVLEPFYSLGYHTSTHSTPLLQSFPFFRVLPITLLEFAAMYIDLRMHRMYAAITRYITLRHHQAINHWEAAKEERDEACGTCG